MNSGTYEIQFCGIHFGLLNKKFNNITLAFPNSIMKGSVSKLSYEGR